MIPLDQIAAVFVELADTLVDDYDVIEFLHQLTVHAAEISGAEAVGLLLIDQRGGMQYMASSNDTGRFLELFQLQTSQGPCWDCVHSQTPVVSIDLESDLDRWPSFIPAALAVGLRSVHAFPMRLRGEGVGALGLFSTHQTRFEPAEMAVIQAVADVATIAILQERTLRHSEALVEQLQGALTSRVVIEQAKGAVARSEGISPDEAFVVLRERARHSRTLLTEVCQGVLDELEQQQQS